MTHVASLIYYGKQRQYIRLRTDNCHYQKYNYILYTY